MFERVSALTIIIAYLFIGGCGLSSRLSPVGFNESSSTACRSGSDGRMYNCAGNCLYALCQMSNIRVSYEECLSLLPLRSEVNSMLELKVALESLGFEVEPQRITVDELANIRVPTIILVLPLDNNKADQMQRVIGHYLVLWPTSDNKFQILDYPRDPIIVDIEHWIGYLRNIGLTNIPVLFCGRRDRAFEESDFPFKIN